MSSGEKMKVSTVRHQETGRNWQFFHYLDPSVECNNCAQHVPWQTAFEKNGHSADGESGEEENVMHF